MTGKIIPLYVICSPFRRVGKTLVARLLTEFHVLHDRAVTAFDLADEGPQLTDYLPNLTIPSDIRKILGQMALFDRIIADRDSAKVIDLSHRTFNDFFSVAQEIGFFAEARRHHIEPLVLFIVDVDPKSSAAYGMLRRSLVDASLLPVRNKAELRELPEDNSPARTSITALEIPLLHFPLKVEIDQKDFSFGEFWGLAARDASDELESELQVWIEHVFYQFQQVERFIGSEPTSMPVGSSSRYPSRAPGREQQRSYVPEEVFKFAPKKQRRAFGMGMTESGTAIIAMLQEAGGELRTAKDRIDQLEIEAQKLERRAARAEAWLQVIKEEIKEKLIEPKLHG